MASLPRTPVQVSAARPLHQSEPGSNIHHDHETQFICSEIENYFGEDLASNKVLLPHDEFLEAILNVPPRWEKSAPDFKKLVDNVGRNSRFCRTLQSYVNLCDDSSKTIQSLYVEFVNVCNEAAGISQQAMNTSKERPLHNYGMHHLIDGQSLEICMLDHGMWANVVLCRNGNDPRHFFPNSPEFIAAHSRVQERNTKSTEIRTGCKRACASSTTYPNKRPRLLEKMRETRTVVPPARPELPSSSLARTEAKGHLKALAQVARRALTLSYMGFRTHSISLLVVRQYIQVLYYDRSALVISPPFDMKNPRRRRQFISLLIAFQLLDLPHSGAMKAFLPDPFPRIFENHATADPSLLLAGQKVFLTMKEERIEITLGRIIYRQPGIIGRSTCVVEGQCAKWPKKKIVVKISWPAVERLSEVGILDNITKAVAAAGKEATWVLNHIPTVLHSQDFPLADNSPGMRLHKLLNDEDTPYAKDTGSFTYELRVCRIIVQGRLYPLSELATPKQYGQVFFDVLQVHRWIYQFARILHRDISEGNIMWHVRGKRICGVLNDFDLSSHLDSPGQTSQQRTGTRPFMAEELHVKNGDVLPLYRHDLESLFYVILLVVCAHSIRQTGKETPRLQVDTTNGRKWHEWLVMTDEELLAAKNVLFNQSTGYVPPVPTSSFNGFPRRVSELHEAFSMGFRAVTVAKETAARVLRRQAAGDDEWDEDRHMQHVEADGETPATLPGQSDGDHREAITAVEGVESGDWDEGAIGNTTQETPLPAVDVETLNGHVTYAVFFNALKAGLVAHFPPT